MEDKLYTRAEVEQTEKGLLAVASSAVEDRHGEIVSVEGWDLKNFKKNPVLLWAHQHEVPAVGGVKSIKVEGSGKNARLIFEPVFHDFTEEARAMKRLYTEVIPELGHPILNSFSVGFRPTEMDGNTYTKQEMLEISPVNVPANPEARMLAIKSLEKDGFSGSVVKSVDNWLQGIKFEDSEENIEIEQLKEVVAEQQVQIASLVKGLQHLNPQGRKDTVITQRLALAKVIARSTDKMLEEKPKGNTALYLKIVKRTAEKLIVDHKQELKSYGKN